MVTSTFDADKRGSYVPLPAGCLREEPKAPNSHILALVQLDMVQLQPHASLGLGRLFHQSLAGIGHLFDNDCPFQETLWGRSRLFLKKSLS
jgi:hypothetical protein